VPKRESDSGGTSSLRPMDASRVRIGLLGCGTVGTSLIQLIEAEGSGIDARTGLRLEVTRVAVRDRAKHREVALRAGAITTDAHDVVTDPQIDVVVEVMGGIEPARQLILDALKNGKPVVTANKELLATAGPEIFRAADGAGVDLLFEAAVAGGIPLVRPLRESLLGEPIRRIMGIVNGTTNYILTRMTEAGASYADALTEAQALGYAEADPTADVEGFDAAAKIAILATIAFGVEVTVGDVHHEGISGITATDIAYATRKGHVVKLLAIAEGPDADADHGRGPIGVRVHPVLLPVTHPLASVRESFNAVFVQGGAVGDLMFYGRGAGGHPTASAVLGDLIDAATNIRKGSSASVGALAAAEIRPVDDLTCEYYLNLEVVDRPGVLSAVAGVFGDHRVSISSMEQEGLGDEARLIFVTHVARESDVQATIADLRNLEAVRHVGSVIRLLKDEAVQP
jgi:homoserine dehydrogenase